MLISCFFFNFLVSGEAHRLDHEEVFIPLQGTLSLVLDGEAIRRQENQLQHPTPKYQYVQLVAYEVPTSVLTGLLPVTSILKPDAAQRLPVPDALNRAQHLLDVLQWAR